MTKAKKLLTSSVNSNAKIGQICPKCGRRGSLQSRWVLNGEKKRYEPYYYFAHYHSKTERNEASMQGTKLSEITWCYIGKTAIRTLSNSILDKALDEDRAQKYLDFLEATARGGVEDEYLVTG